MTEVQAEEKPANDPIVGEKTKTLEDKGEECKESVKNGDHKQINSKEKDGDSEEESDEELGSLEKPVEILTSKRSRKSTERLSLDKYAEPKKSAADELDFSKGTGTKLGDIPFVKHQIDKTATDDLKIFHRILFFKAGKSTMIKKNIRTFCGFPFDKDSSSYTKASNAIDRQFVTSIKSMLGILGLEKGGERSVIRDRLLDFLMNPKDLGKSPVVKKSKKKSTSKSKKTSDKSKKSSKSKKDPKSSESVSGDNDVSSASEDSDDGNEDDVEPEEKIAKKTPKKTPKKVEEKKKKKSSPKKATTIKIPVPKKKKEASPKKRKADDDSDDDDEEPLLKKKKSEPSDAELRTVISTILKDADLEQVTMKTVVKQVYEKYPAFDLTSRKDFIKNTVKEIIS